MGTGSSSTPLLDARNSSTSEGRREKSKTEKKSSDCQGQLDAILLANKHKMKVEEVRLLWKRFQQLGPDKSGHVARTVFSDSPVYSNIFCKQVWGRIAGLEKDSSKISFEKFLTNIRQFQYDSVDEKLRRYFDWMSDSNNRLTRDRLNIILHHAMIDEDTEATDSTVDNMMKVMDPQDKGYITCDVFVKFLHTIPEDQLSRVLSFNIIKDDDSGHHSEHSSLDSQPI